MKRLVITGIVLLMLLAACSPQASGVSMTAQVSTAISGTVVAVTVPANYTPPPAATPIPPTNIPAVPGGLPAAELKYRLLAAYPDFFYCDPDFYPVAAADEMQLALERFPQIQADQEQLQVILSHNGLSGLTTFTDEQKLLIYHEYKKLNALMLELVGDRYRFQIQVGQEGGNATLLTGTIDGQGNIHIESKDSTFATCPICLALGTSIETPNGSVPVQDLQVGDKVWTLSPGGTRISAPIIEVGHMPVPATHRMVHVVLGDGRSLWASPGHPLPDGQRIGELQAGDVLDGATIMSVERVPYSGGATYDILPAGGTGFYWAEGILLASTLSR
jgi:hypothetical protein